MKTASPPPITALPTRSAVMGQAGDENFTVASFVLGRARRRHLLSLYGFARLVDDVGDEAPGDRLALLDVVEAELDGLYAGGHGGHPVMQELGETIRECHLPDGPFRRLIEANRQDQRVHRYETFDELLGYCQLSAAPVGELVLHVFGRATPERIALSDRICAGLQVIEHLQDVREDLGRGRVYLPQEDLRRFRCLETDLTGTPSRAWRELMQFEIERARGMLKEGAPLARTLPLRPRLAVAGFVAGGRSALRRLERQIKR